MEVKKKEDRSGRKCLPSLTFLYANGWIVKWG